MILRSRDSIFSIFSIFQDSIQFNLRKILIYLRKIFKSGDSNLIPEIILRSPYLIFFISGKYWYLRKKFKSRDSNLIPEIILRSRNFNFFITPTHIHTHTTRHCEGVLNYIKCFRYCTCVRAKEVLKCCVDCGQKTATISTTIYVS